MIKPTGVRFSLIYGDEKSTTVVIKAIEKKRIGSEGFGYVFVA